MLSMLPKILFKTPWAWCGRWQGSVHACESQPQRKEGGNCWSHTQILSSTATIQTLPVWAHTSYPYLFHKVIKMDITAKNYKKVKLTRASLGQWNGTKGCWIFPSLSLKLLDKSRLSGWLKCSLLPFLCSHWKFWNWFIQFQSA